MKNAINLTPTERRKEGNRYYSRYMLARYVDNGRFTKTIHSLGGYVYNTHVGKIGEATIFNGGTWLSVKNSESYKDNDEWAKRFEQAFVSLFA